jgi:hypothetical protein
MRSAGPHSASRGLDAAAGRQVADDIEQPGYELETRPRADTLGNRCAT